MTPEENLINTILHWSTEPEVFNIIPRLNEHLFSDDTCKRTFRLIWQQYSTNKPFSWDVIGTIAFDVDMDLNIAINAITDNGSPTSTSIAFYYDKVVADHLDKVRKDTCLKLAECNTQDSFDNLMSKYYEYINKFSTEEFESLTDISTRETKKLLVVRETPKLLQSFPIGVPYFDDMITFKPGQFVIIAARPAMGKTAFMLWVAQQLAKQSSGTAILTLEMARGDLATRMLSMFSGVPSFNLESGNFSDREQELLLEANVRIETIPIYIDDTPVITAMTAKAKLAKQKKLHNIKVGFIDYLTLMQMAGRQGLREKVTELTRQLKLMAKSLGITLIVLAQLSRAVEDRNPPRPQLSDLRESGSIEQDADIVMFLYRPEYYQKMKGQDIIETDRDRAELIIAKQRGGPTGSLNFNYITPLHRFFPLGG